jgi:hypothetical protein
MRTGNRGIGAVWKVPDAFIREDNSIWEFTAFDPSKENKRKLAKGARGSGFGVKVRWYSCPSFR